MNRKTVYLLVTLSLILAILVGCHQAEPEVIETEPPTVEEPEVEEEPVVEGIDYSTYEGTELVFLRHSGYDADYMVQKAEEFYELSGIRVTIEQVAYGEVHNKMVVDISGENGIYDMIALTDYWTPEFYEGGWIIDQNQFFENPDLLDPDYNLADVSQSMLDANTINGDLLAIPWKFNSQFLFYRTDLIDAPPTNWEEQLALAEEHTGDDTFGVALALAKTSAMDVYLNLLYQNGGQLLSDDLTTCLLDSQEAKEALEYLVELSQYTNEGALNSHWNEASTLFATGGAALAPNLVSQAGGMIDPEVSSVVDSVGFAELPGSVTSAAASNTWGIAITKNSDNPEAAFLYIQYLTRADNIRELVASTNGSAVPIRSSLLSDPEFLETYPWFSVMNSIATTPGHAFAYPKTTQNAAIMDILAGHVQNAVNGTETVDEALQNAKTEIEDLL